MNNIEIFSKVLEKLRFKEPVPDAVKKFVAHNKPAALVGTLKQTGEYSIVYGFILKVYYSLGRSGISITITQSKLIFALAASILGVAVTASAALSYNYIKNADEIIPENAINSILPEKQPVVTKEHDSGQAGETGIKKSSETLTKKKLPVEPAEDKLAVKKLTVITTKDGKTYTGTFKALGKNVEVITENGKVTISSGDIKEIAPYKGE